MASGTPEFPLNYQTLLPRSGTGPHPALILFHGRGADEHDLLPLAAELDPRLLVVSVRAPFRFPGAGFAWYGLDPQGVGSPDAGSLHVSIGLLDRLLRELPNAYPIDARRVYTGGFSMGAVMAGTLGLLYPDRVAGSILLSGYLPLQAGLPFRPGDAAGHPFFEAHGRADQVIPVSFGRETRDYLAATPVELTYVEYPAGHEITLPELRDLSEWLAGVLRQEPRTSPSRGGEGEAG